MSEVNNFYGISIFEEQIVLGNSTITPTEIITSNITATDAFIENLSIGDNSMINVNGSGNITNGTLTIRDGNVYISSLLNRPSLATDIDGMIVEGSATQELDRQLQEAKATIQNQINDLLSRIIALENK